MKFLYVLASALVAAASVEAGAPVERSNWYYPFWRQSCTGCAAAGNVLPWCVKVPAANIVCPVGAKPTAINSCLRVGYAVAAGTAATANALSAAGAAKLSIAGSQITCADGAIDGSCIQLTAESFPADFVIPSSTTIGAGQVTCSADNPISADCISAISSGVTIGASQVTCSASSPISSACIGAISSGVTITGAQVTSAVAAANSSLTANGLVCPATAGSATIPSCYTLNATQLTGPLASGVTLSGSQITGGEIPSTVVFNGTFDLGGCNSIKSCLGITGITKRGADAACTGNAGQALTITVSCSNGPDFYTAASCKSSNPPPDTVVTCTGTWAATLTDSNTCTYTCTADLGNACGTDGPWAGQCFGIN